jgi:hypothetical protein
MSGRDDAREILRELLHEALGATNGNAVTPQVPPPPVAAVLRPSTWSAPPAGGEDGARPGGEDGARPGGEDGVRPSVGEAGARPGGEDAGGRGLERVTLDSDADLDRFVRALLARFEDPEAREAIRSGRLRFTLGGAEAAGVMRVERGALTERRVQQAAKAGARLVLGPAAVATPLAREKARALGIEIERGT